MTQNDKWNNFLQNGSVLAYLSYAADKIAAGEGEQPHEASDTGTDNQGNTGWGK